MTVLLTGGTGFLGSHLLERLLDQGESVTVLKRSTSSLSRVQAFAGRYASFDLDRVALDDVLSQTRPDVIIHCATNYGRRSVPPTEMVEANLILPLHLLQLAEKYEVRSFINTDTILDKRVSHYSLSKGQFEDWLKLYSAKLVCANVALEHFYGPSDDPTKFVTYIIHQLLNQVDRIELTPGRQKRDFIFIDDVIEAFMKVIEFSRRANRGFHSFEVGSARSIEIRTFVELIRSLSGNTRTRLEFGALPYREAEVMESQVDTESLRALGWTAKVELNEGLQRTISHERTRLLK